MGNETPTFECRDGDLAGAYEIVENFLWELFSDFLESEEAKALVQRIIDDLEDSGESHIDGNDINKYIRHYFNNRYN